MDIDNLTIGQAKELAKQFSNCRPTDPIQHTRIPVVVCTDKRAVVFGYTTDVNARPITVTEARMCLYWSPDVGGVFGLSEKGPTAGCKISATTPQVVLEGVTAVFSVDPSAEVAWSHAEIQGR